MLPFDLHVLSLPLAFILSQDQTLRCINLMLQSDRNPVDIMLAFVFYLFNFSKELTPLSKGAQRYIYFYSMQGINDFIFTLLSDKKKPLVFRFEIQEVKTGNDILSQVLP